MPAKVVIRLIEAPTDPYMLHIFRNCGEDLWRQIELPRLGDIGGLETIDTARDCFTIELGPRGNANRTVALIRDILDQHHLTWRTTLAIND